MFLGKGDTSKLTEDEQVTLAHLRRMFETGHVVAMSPEQTEVAVRAIVFYSRWESLLAMVQSFRNVSILVAGGLMFWWATGGENFITQIVRNMAGP